MPHLLHLDTSARSDSFSRELGATFVDHWRAAQPNGTYTYRDLVKDPVEPIDEAGSRLVTESSVHGVQDLAAMDELASAPELAPAWAVTRPLIHALLSADVLVIGAPMYNFSVPGSLKTWMDRVTLPWLPLSGKTAVILSARGGAYGPGTPREPFDFQEPYLRAYFSTLNLTDIEFVHTELTHAPAVSRLAHLRDIHDTSRATALDRVKELAHRLPPTVRSA
ncbi:FMN-dependent NADH-azoreductase [Streptomyces sp. NPDC087440]|uniref:FMN-dependent NADH-azoreductase n=1 Tax=Streptomyces sp. NPDC087440 TaxID=3365790 RepID=UPI0037FF459F